MNSAISTAVSGLLASSARLNASASNVANARTRGPVPATPPSRPVQTGATAGSEQVYQAVTTVQTDLGGTQGVGTRYAPKLPSYGFAYDPDAPFADEKGMVATPNVDLTTEIVDQISARQSFEANLATIRTANEMQKSLLKLKV